MVTDAQDGKGATPSSSRSPETGRAPLSPSERRVALGEAGILLGYVSVFEDVENLAVSRI